MASLSSVSWRIAVTAKPRVSNCRRTRALAATRCRPTAALLATASATPPSCCSTSCARAIDTGQRNVLHTMIEDTNTDMKRFLTNMVSGVDKLEDILERDYTRLVNALQEKKK